MRHNISSFPQLEIEGSELRDVRSEFRASYNILGFPRLNIGEGSKLGMGVQIPSLP